MHPGTSGGWGWERHPASLPPQPNSISFGGVCRKAPTGIQTRRAPTSLSLLIPGTLLYSFILLLPRGSHFGTIDTRGWISLSGGCPVHSRMFSSNPSLYLPDAFKQSQMPPKVQNCPQLRTTALAGDACELRVLFAHSLCLFSVFFPVECKFSESGDFLFFFSLMYLKCLKQCLSHSWNVKFGQCWDNMGHVKTTWAMESTGLGSVPNQVTD